MDTNLISPVLGLWMRVHLQAVKSFQPIFLGSCHKVRTWNLRWSKWDVNITLCKKDLTQHFSRANANYLSCCVSSMPQCIPKVFSWTCGGIDHFDGQSRVALCFCGYVRPIGLCDLFPHHHVEAGTGLIAEHKSSIIVISVSIDEEGSTEIHCIKFVIS